MPTRLKSVPNGTGFAKLPQEVWRIPLILHDTQNVAAMAIFPGNLQAYAQIRFELEDAPALNRGVSP